ncbi:MAG: GNAT family N-acetyltransferase [Actinomycetota bacterium]|nr:MAG: GNAT family N-acetyltransferase [Actinomycetota bacterium]
MTTIRGERVVLRPFRPEEIETAMAHAPAQTTEHREAWRRRLALSGTRTTWEILFAVEAEGRLVGDVQARSSDQAVPPGVWEIGLDLWDAADRGRGIGTEVVALLTRHLFAREGAHRVQATTDVDNVAMRRALERCGFRLEGVLRAFMPVADGPPRDHAMYAITRADVEGEAPYL